MKYSFNLLSVVMDRAPATSVLRSCSLALTLALVGCGQMGPLYQPIPEAPQAEDSATEPASTDAPGRSE
ncbi:LPS translocon maturation chaperone LptM [Congregibacter sp.]|uniref:LPS translocon maturation chaperone LptM n=1 Tax=Congregibacter sp. TaxID=2744308 RepID=UPI003F6BC391